MAEKYHTKLILPGSVTMMNWACGIASIVFSLQGDYITAAVLIIVAAVLDLFDGLVARLTHAVSDFGKQLDSLADATSFGLAPSLMLYLYVEESALWPVWISFAIAGCAILRLAWFNADATQKNNFKGLPVPAAALFFAGLIIPVDLGEISLHHILLDPAMLIIILFISVLMLIPIPLFSLKFTDMSWSKNAIRYIFLIFSVGLLLIFKIIALPLIVLLYILMGLVWNLLPRKKSQV